MTDFSTYQLKHPISTTFVGPHGERVEMTTELTLRRATGKDMRIADAYQGRPIALELAMIAALCGLTERQVDSLDAEDITFLGELAQSSFGNGPPTGESASPNWPSISAGPHPS